MELATRRVLALGIALSPEILDEADRSESER